TALALARGGARVRLHDPGSSQANASGVAAGRLAPVSEALTDPAAAPHLDLLTAALRLWPDFAQAVGLSLHRAGAILLGDGERLSQLARAQAAFGLEPARLARADFPDFNGGYAPELAGGLKISGDWRVDAGGLGRLSAAVSALGVEHCVAAPDRADYDLLVLATGPSRDYAGLAPELAVLSPIKGHILSYPGLVYGGPVLRGPGAYAAPSERGLLVGATMEVGQRDPAVDPVVAEHLAAQASAIFPGLATQPWIAAAGVRAATPDGLPLVGPVTAPGVILACGARRNGWLLAPLVGQMAAAYALGGDPGPWARRLDARRFNSQPPEERG
ncbi:MAG: FAD-dependent oxidoreductase, partial [Phenylobacterium sp.]|uniref:NAD(P)/FAD-dependent oxidoreductase n=1 Tax=Phenylobacterium sp. TaxID=1871053 RepID=UPI002718841C